MTANTILPPAPIALFTYNRVWHTRQTVDALRRNDLAAESELIVFSDGPKSGQPREAVDDVRRYLKTITGFKRVEIHERPENGGLAKNIIEGVTHVLERYGRVIVLEDDIGTSPGFLRFCNEALTLYQDDARVGMVHAHIYDIPGLPDLFFTYKAGCLGWATWKRAWDEVRFDGPALLNELRQRKLCRRFDVNGSYPYCKLLENQIRGKNNSWAVRMYASFLLKDRLTFNVGRSLTTHLGFDTGTHCRGAAEPSPMDGRITDNPPRCALIPVTENPDALKKIERFYRFRRLHTIRRMVKQASRPAVRLAKRLVAVLRPAAALFHALTRRLHRPNRQFLQALQPTSTCFGLDRGTPIDRLYIEKFLKSNQASITGHVLEIGGRTYSDRFGAAVTRQEVLHVTPDNPEATIVADLSNPPSLPENAMDCVICTQTLNFIYDVPAAVQGLRRLLRENGVALVTVAGISQISRYDMDRWGDYWRFTPLSLKRCFEDAFGPGHVVVDYDGNAFAAKAFLDGLAVEDVPLEALLHKDRDYPVTLTVKAIK